MVQRRLLNLGELNTTQIDRWQRSIEVIEEDGRARQRRLSAIVKAWLAAGGGRVRSGALEPFGAAAPELRGLVVRMPAMVDKFWFAALGEFARTAMDVTGFKRRHHCQTASPLKSTPKHSSNPTMVEDLHRRVPVSELPYQLDRLPNALLGILHAPVTLA